MQIILTLRTFPTHSYLTANCQNRQDQAGQDLNNYRTCYGIYKVYIYIYIYRIFREKKTPLELAKPQVSIVNIDIEVWHHIS